MLSDPHIQSHANSSPKGKVYLHQTLKEIRQQTMPSIFATSEYVNGKTQTQTQNMFQPEGPKSTTEKLGFIVSNRGGGDITQTSSLMSGQPFKHKKDYSKENMPSHRLPERNHNELIDNGARLYNGYMVLNDNSSINTKSKISLTPEQQKSTNEVNLIQYL